MEARDAVQSIDDECPKGTKDQPNHWCGNADYKCVHCGVGLTPERCGGGCRRLLYPEQMHADEGVCVDCRSK